MLRLELPAPEYAERVMDYKAECLANGEELCGTGGLDVAATFDEWYAAWRAKLAEATVPAGLVPATTYLAVDDGRLVGMIDLRHRLNDHLLRVGGHIGYSVRPCERRRGYATRMLTLALDKCRELGLARVLVTCDKDNVASARTIMRCGGVLEDELPDGDRVVQRYWIGL